MKSETLTSFRALPRALAEAAYKPSTFVVYEEDDMLSCIWRILSDNRPRTAGEIATLLRDTEWKVAAISMALRRLANEGSFEVILAANKNLNAYKIKKGMEMAVDVSNKKPRKFETESKHVHSDRGIIRIEEGIDVCIWKATADRRSRLIDEISDILFQYGLQRVTVKDRIIYLANAKKWFDRQGKSKNTRYSLKKGIAMPVPLVTEAEIASSALSAGTVHTRVEEYTPQPAPQPEVKANVAVEPAPVPTHTFNKADGFHINIWKAMSDYREYTATEVGILLEVVGFNPKSVGVQIGELWKKKQWFDRRHIEGTKSYAYTLRREIEMPEPLVPAPVPAKETQPQLALDAEPEIETAAQPKEENMADTQQQPKEEPALFDFTLKLKGIPFDLNEARALAAELEKIDFTPEDKPEEGEQAEPALLESTYRIKGIEFTRGQLRMVKSKLNNIGLRERR